MAGQLMSADIRPREEGFTLIELLVVIAVLSVLTAGSALLAIRRSDGPPRDVAAFQNAHDRMRTLAVHEQGLRGIYVTPRGRRMAQRVGDAWQTTGPELRWQGRVRFDAAIRPRRGEPDIVFFPNGQSSAFEALFANGDGETRCRSDGWTGLRCEAL